MNTELDLSVVEDKIHKLKNAKEAIELATERGVEEIKEIKEIKELIPLIENDLINLIGQSIESENSGSPRLIVRQYGLMCVASVTDMIGKNTPQEIFVIVKQFVSSYPLEENQRSSIDYIYKATGCHRDYIVDNIVEVETVGRNFINTIHRLTSFEKDSRLHKIRNLIKRFVMLRSHLSSILVKDKNDKLNRDKKFHAQSKLNQCIQLINRKNEP